MDAIYHVPYHCSKQAENRQAYIFCCYPVRLVPFFLLQRFKVCMPLQIHLSEIILVHFEYLNDL
jgi:predicted metal-binding transcription factor (methanogenesis marker protein 9)